jgi:thiamine biosynthesis lipoprotein
MGYYSNYYESSKLMHGSIMNIMGTRLDALLIGAERAESMLIWSEIEAEVKRLDKMLNKYDKDSEVSNVNKKAEYFPVSVNDELWTILIDCRRYFHLTLGYFDISLKDFSSVLLDENNQTVFFNRKSVQLDLGGYAKGYALEKIRNILMTHGIAQAFINFGNSSVLALGSHPHGENWTLGINNPYQPKETVGIIELHNNTISTSGNMPQHTEHIINPFTGVYSKDRRILSIVAKNAIEAEVLSTALMIAEEKVTQAILSHFNIDRYLSFSL